MPHDVTIQIDPHASDASMIGAVSDVVALPRIDPADSFVLHAPLELLARAALLRYVRPDQRSIVRQRLLELGDAFEGFGEPVRPPRLAGPEPDTLAQAARSLDQAIERSDLEQVDALASWLGRRARPDQLPGLLADALVPRLSAAGHAPIFLWLYPRVAPHGEASGELLRQLCRELARHPQWRLHWIDDRPWPSGDIADPAADDLFRVLADPPRLGRPASAFIHPLMSRVDTAKIAARLLGPLVGGHDIEARAHVLTRVAAWSMLLEPGAEAPYGWSHCLTMPQAVLGISGACSDASMALAVAATHVLGFRASLATIAVEETVAASWQPSAASLDEAIATGPVEARAVAWHWPASRRRSMIDTLATVAAVHHDAHLAKYTLACIDATVIDPDGARVYLAAAATLAGWWSAHPAGVEIA